jgi:hypothetical protein
MPNTLLFYIIFISQIWLISYYYPQQVVARIKYVIKNFPPEDYSKLYPEPPKKVESLQKTYIYFNYVVAIVGLAIMSYFGLFTSNTTDKYLEHIPLMYGMSQFIPLILLEVLGYKQLSLMRKMDNRTNRKAILQPRRLFDYVSPILVVAAALMYVIITAFELYMTQFTITFDLLVKLGSITLTNILFIGITLFNLYGKKLDPFQASEDRIKQVKFSIRSLIFISIFVSLFMMAQTLVNTFDLNYLEIIINSLYFQILAIFSMGAILRNFKVEEMNFDGYKNEVESA